MKILAPAFILLTLLAACQQQTPVLGYPSDMGMGAGHEANETAAMEAMEGPGQ